MQKAIAEAVRRAAPETLTPGVKQSWRVQAVITGAQPACPTLEAAIDERIVAGASDEDVMAIAHTVVRHTREKLIAARPEFAALTRDLTAAMIYETQQQGPADVAMLETFSTRCANSLRAFLNRMIAHRDAADIVIVATEREIAEREHQRDMGRATLSGGRAS